MYILSLGNMEFVTEIDGTEVAYDCYFSTQTLARVSGKTLSLIDKETGEVVAFFDPDDEEEDDDYCDDFFDDCDECGFDAYCGCYTYDC
jgi:hypothetical protein